MYFHKVFSCFCFTYIPHVKIDKLDKKVIIEIIIQYNQGFQILRLTRKSLRV